MRYSDYTVGWKNEESWFESLWGQEIFTSSNLPDQLWGPPSLLSMEKRSAFPRGNAAGMKM
jgi:hypothetical protein